MKTAVCSFIPHPAIKGLYLGVARRDNPAMFGLPGGKVEPGETLEEAVIRETKEETGLTISGLKLVYETECEGTNGISYFVSTFTAQKLEGEIRSSSEGRVMWIVKELLTEGPFGKYNKALFEAVSKTE